MEANRSVGRILFKGRNGGRKCEDENRQALPAGPGHPFYAKLNQVLAEAAFDRFVENLCAPWDNEGGCVVAETESFQDSERSNVCLMRSVLPIRGADGMSFRVGK